MQLQSAQASTEVHLVDINRLSEDLGLVFCLELVQESSEQNTEGAQLHLKEGLLQFNLKPSGKGKTLAEQIVSFYKASDHGLSQKCTH